MGMKPEELKEKMKGILIVLMTPFTEKDELDEEGLRENIDFILDKCRNKDVIIISTGSTGECYALTDDEWKKTVKITVEEVNGAFPVVVGTMKEATKLTIERSKYAQEVGADGVMIVPPYYHLPSTEGLYNHYKKIAESINIGVTIYNNPVVSKVWIDPKLMKKLSKIENIIACKENTGDLAKYYSMTQNVDSKDMVFVTGRGELYYSYAVMHGCRGFITSIANFAPELDLELYDAGSKLDVLRIRSAIKKLEPIMNLRSKYSERLKIPHIMSAHLGIDSLSIYQAILKEAMNLVGLRGGKVRLPMDNLNNEEIKELKQVLKETGVL